MIQEMLNIYIAISMVKPRKLFLELRSTYYGNKEIIPYYIKRKNPDWYFFKQIVLSSSPKVTVMLLEAAFLLAFRFKNFLYMIQCEYR